MRTTFSKPASVVILASALWVPTSALADDFAAGSLVIPMDTDYQDAGMLHAYGLVYALLSGGVPVRWVIAPGKDHGDPDFTASAADFVSGAAVDDHAYRGGPWVVDEVDAATAGPIVDDWLADHPTVAVHVTTAAFTGHVSRYLVVAPTIAMVADGNQKIARKYMEAADIPDSIGDATWPDTSPDMLDVPELMGPTDTDHADGALFDEDGDPVYCQLMSMHWGVNDAEDNPEVVAEVRQYLNNPTHLFAECQAVNAFENLDPHGFFLTPNGFLFADRPDAVDFYNQDSPYAQLDGEFGTVGGSEPAYSLPPGDMYKAGGITMMTAAGAAEGVQDVWMTGFLDGKCPPDQPECGAYGKVSYLGGHEYSVMLPISANPDTQGTRLFLNSMFEAPCATLDGLPNLALATGAPACVVDEAVTIALTYVNTSEATALAGSVRMTLPAGATFVAADQGGVEAGGDVVWDVGNLGPDESGDLRLMVTLDGGAGVYAFAAVLEYRVGRNDFTLPANTTEVELVDDAADCPASGTTGDDDGAGSTSGDSDGQGSASTASGGSGSGSASGTAESGDETAGDSASAGDDGGADSGGASEDESGCGCSSGGGSAGLPLLALLGLAAGRRRRALALALGCAGCSGRQGSGVEGGTGEDLGDGSGPSTSESTAEGGEGQRFDVAGDLDVPDQPSVGCKKIDFLFVIDSSGSMEDNQTNLIDSFPGLVDALLNDVEATDWHLMVVDTDGQWSGSDCANACLTLGSCPTAPAFDCATAAPGLCDITLGAGITAPYGEAASNEVCELGGDRRFIRSDASDLETTFSCVARVGVDGADQERPAAAMLRAIGEDLEADGACNGGFLRDDAILVVTIITDEPDEHTEGTPAEWAQAVVDAKLGNPDAVVVLGLLPDGDLPTPLCGAEAVPAPTLVEFLGEFAASSWASVCEPDYSPFFVDAVSVISDTCSDFLPPG